MKARLVVAIALATLLAGCQSVYFQPVDRTADASVRYRLAEWPDRDYWAGIVFNGDKIGFSHLSIAPAATPGRYEIRSDSAFALRFLGFEKRVNLKSYDVVRDDLDLVSFRYEYVIDGNAMTVDGERRGDALAVTVTQGGKVDERRVAAPSPVYPQVATVLYPSLNGLAVGREFRYIVYSGELQKTSEVVQRIAAYEKSRLFDGEAFRVETTMEGYTVQTWIDRRGAPLLEIAMSGVLISGLETEARARSYLAAASLNKSEALIDFALAKPDRPVDSPRDVTTLRVALAGARRAVPSAGPQRCDASGGETVCTIRTAERASDTTDSPPHDPAYLASTFTVPARDPAIVAQAKAIGGASTDPRERVRLLVDWIEANVRTSPMDVWTALDVLQKREAECQGHAYLYTAFARSLAIPTRVVNGIVYSEEHRGFLYHTWAESYVGGRWLAIDPTFAQVPADATHVKLVDGEALADLTPLVDWIGRLKVRVLAVEHGG